VKQSAEFLGTRGQLTGADAADRGCIVRHDRHRELHPGTVPAFVAQLSCPPTQQAGDDTFHHRAAVACGTGQLDLARSPLAVQVGGGQQLLDRRRRRRGRLWPKIPVTREGVDGNHFCGK